MRDHLVKLANTCSIVARNWIGDPLGLIRLLASPPRRRY
jgi:hypothetical protein